MSDADLWEAAARGDGEGFGVVFDRHVARVRRHASALVPAADAEDVVAATFLEAWRHRDRVRFVDGSLLPWLLRTATFTASNVRRARRRYRAALDRLPPPVPAPAPELGEAEEALVHLTPAHRQVVVLCILEGLTAADAAAVLGVNEGTVKSRLSRAKQVLRERLQGHAAMSAEGVVDASG